jgi:hypothetical protein
MRTLFVFNLVDSKVQDFLRSISPFLINSIFAGRKQKIHRFNMKFSLYLFLLANQSLPHPGLGAKVQGRKLREPEEERALAREKKTDFGSLDDPTAWKEVSHMNRLNLNLHFFYILEIHFALFAFMQLSRNKREKPPPLLLAT